MSQVKENTRVKTPIGNGIVHHNYSKDGSDLSVVSVENKGLYVFYQTEIQRINTETAYVVVSTLLQNKSVFYRGERPSDYWTDDITKAQTYRYQDARDECLARANVARLDEYSFHIETFGVIEVD